MRNVKILSILKVNWSMNIYVSSR